MLNCQQLSLVFSRFTKNSQHFRLDQTSFVITKKRFRNKFPVANTVAQLRTGHPPTPIGADNRKTKTKTKLEQAKDEGSQLRKERSGLCSPLYCIKVVRVSYMSI